MEILKGATKYTPNFNKKRYLDRRDNSKFNKYPFLPLPWQIWPYEGKLLITMLGIWSILGLFILGSASWWVASKEMGYWAYYLKRPC